MLKNRTGRSILFSLKIVGVMAVICSLLAIQCFAGWQTHEKSEYMTFITGDFYESPVKDENDALAAIQSVYEFIGGDDLTALEPLSIRANEDSMICYNFLQLQGDMPVDCSIVKLITDGEGNVCALSSSLVPGIEEESMHEWGITGEEAEKIVLANNIGRKLTIVEGATSQVLLPVPEMESQFYYAWVVYTNNINTDYDVAYLAHYVSEDGTYLYEIPVAEPGNADSLSGEGASLIFLDYEADTWSGTISLHDGTTTDVTIPVLKDKKTGQIVLGDMERKVIVADQADFDFNKAITVREAKDGRFDDHEVMIYKTFLDIYDIYSETGWIGPDGDGTPVLLLMDWVNEDGTPVDNACYSGRQHGYQTFMFNRNDPDGECIDIMAHEFTHCITDTLLQFTQYYNEYGAINESISDICGNLIEEIASGIESEEWEIGESSQAFRSMSNPHFYYQPKFIWDLYYAPRAETFWDGNDYGGVHIDSSLLNQIGYRLDKSGASNEDQLYFWMNMLLIMNPDTDFKEMTEMMPWCAQKLGYDEFIPVLNAAIEETGMANNSLPEKPAQGCGQIEFEVSFNNKQDSHAIMAVYYNPDTDDVFESWPEKNTDRVAVTVTPGRYNITLYYYVDGIPNMPYKSVAFTEDGWVEVSDEELSLMTMLDYGLKYVEVKDGDVIKLDSSTLAPIIEKAEKELNMDDEYSPELLDFLSELFGESDGMDLAA